MHNCCRAERSSRWCQQQKKERPVSFFSISLLWERGDVHHSSFFFSNAAWLSVKNRRPDLRTTHRPRQGGTREGEEERGALTYWKPRPQTLPKDLYISHKDRTHHRCRLQLSLRDAEWHANAFPPWWGTAACFTSIQHRFSLRSHTRADVWLDSG